MAGINKAIILGRLTADPEMLATASGQTVTKFSVATSETWKDKTSGEKVEKAEFSRIVVWGKLAELCNEYLAKGRQVYLEGKIQTRNWDDKDGNKRYITEIVAKEVQFLGSGGGKNAPSENKNDGGVDFISGSGEKLEDSDVPF